MMKKLLITFITALMVSASFGQITTTIAPHTPGDTVRASHIDIVAYYTNTGSTAIPAGDTLIFGLTLNGGFLSFGGTSGSYNYKVLDYSLAPGGRFEYATSIPLVGVTSLTYYNICAYGTIGVNNISSASAACYVINASWASTPEITLEETTKVFVANGILNMSSTAKENLTYTVVSITGQVVSQGTFNSNKQVDLNGVAKGIYAIVITNGTEKVTKKVAVQ